MRVTNALKFWAAAAILACLLPTVTQAQYPRKDLTSNQSGGLPIVNPELVNAWGLVQLGTSPMSGAILIDNLWGIQFGHDGGAANGGPQGPPHNSLFFTAGPNSYGHGLFGVILPRAN